jgi:hypothetical protein
MSGRDKDALFLKRSNLDISRNLKNLIINLKVLYSQKSCGFF